MVEKKVYTPDFQRMVAKAYYTSDKSMAKIGKEFNVNASSVYGWAQRYKEDFSGEVSIRQEMSTFKSVINVAAPMKKKELTPEQMEQRIIELEAQLKREQMRSNVLDKMIDLAEQDLKIPIRKKSGAKQSK
ncbi:MAG: helix-turn-helix domain-containing protein [Rikenellaceae bacterium]|jgi:transposase-like protein|nr:helix-turn-helix domain-containing protein [Rikenellaceae bacterium]